jgi:acetyl esterase
VISPIMAKMFNKLYVKKKSELKYPLVSPLLSVDFENLPSALIITCEYDSLADEGKNYSIKLENSKVRVKHKRFLKCEHGFINKKCKEADEACDLICSTLKTEFYNY